MAYKKLKSKVIKGEYDPADRIDAATLTDQLGMGRTPVREALLRLQAQGIVEILPKRGVRIVTLSAQDLTDIYQVISTIEVEAVRLLAERKPDMEELAPLVDATAVMRKTAEKQDREGWALADERFHRSLLKLCPNRRLAAVGQHHRDLAQRAHFVALRYLSSDQRLLSVVEHMELVSLISRGDSQTAAKDHASQRKRGAKMLVDILLDHRMSRL
jgi:DNA-binding GntR family transcriptional regulator